MTTRTSHRTGTGRGAAAPRGRGSRGGTVQRPRAGAARPRPNGATARDQQRTSPTRRVLAAHAADLWGVALATVAVLTALAVYADGLGPAGRAVRTATGALVGWARFLLPMILVGAAVVLFTGRRGTDDGGAGRREPVRAVLGAGILLVAVSGMAALAGGSPGFGSAVGRLSRAGGWLGAAVGDPLRAGLGALGATVVLCALSVAAAVLFTGVPVRTVAGWCLRLVRSAGSALRRPVPAEGGAPPAVVADEPTDPFGAAVARAVAAGVPGEPPGGWSLAGEPETTEPTGAPVGVPEVDVDPPAGTAILSSGLDDPDPVTVPGEPAAAPAAGRRASGPADQLELRLGPEVGDWRLPPLSLLKRSRPQAVDDADVDAAGRDLVASLAAHGVETRLVGRTVGPSVTRYELELGAGVKVARVTSLSKDIAYAMASPDVRILAPIPGRSAIGVEVPNRRRQLVALADILTSPEAAKAHHPLEVALGRDIAGRPVIVNLAEMPHVLVSGATGSGKSSCINSVLTSILMRATPEQVRLILVDPKRVELGQYNDLPHLLTQVVVEPKKAANALSWAVKEMERRYDLLAEVGMRDITGYNTAFDRGDLAEAEEVHRLRTLGAGDADGDAGGSGDGEPEPRYGRLPFVVIVVDELNDLMMVAARDVEESVCRIAQMARAVGIHLVLATQRPSVDVITGVIKANIPSRWAFSVSSLADSRVILDQPGAERLIGKGDMLLLTASSSNPQRIQGPWVSEEEVRGVVAHWRRQRAMEVVAGIEDMAGPGSEARGGSDDDDELLAQAMDLVVRSQLGSTSMLQRKLRVGFARAGRLMDLLERRGVVGPSEGSKARQVLMTPEELDAR